MDPLPRFAAFRLVDATDGFEVCFFEATRTGFRLDGQSTGVEDGAPWALGYSIETDADWITRRATIRSLSGPAVLERRIEADGAGGWELDGRSVAELDGCLDIDLEVSSCTNTLPVHRLGLKPSESGESAAAFVRAPGLEVERLDQSYLRLPDGAQGLMRYDYSSPRFGFRAVLSYDSSGLIREYPGIAERFV